ncbi:TMEM175 family protein [Aquabacter cavernae]|uniref:TMEM175 family protein n=1 Tax=Aquabacter cavernae TaxID=2496029 RepID=UPI000F8C578F|nr:TMEM175 family protein [Aquabacter cavernae]
MAESRFPKSRIDALTDGIFAFSMTLLVLDVRVPGDLPITSAAELTAHLLSLSRPLIAYGVGFFVLGAVWRGAIEHRQAEEKLTGKLVSLWLALLFFVTMVPFSSGLVSRYGDFLPAVLVYSGNMLMLAALLARVRYLEVVPAARSVRAAISPYLALFICSALLSLVISLFDPAHAMFAYFVNFARGLPVWGGKGEGR